MSSELLHRDRRLPSFAHGPDPASLFNPVRGKAKRPCEHEERNAALPKESMYVYKPQCARDACSPLSLLSPLTCLVYDSGSSSAPILALLSR